LLNILQIVLLHILKGHSLSPKQGKLIENIAFQRIGRSRRPQMAGIRQQD
jgi:hypothetical protein